MLECHGENRKARKHRGLRALKYLRKMRTCEKGHPATRDKGFGGWQTMSSTDRGSEYLWTLWTCEPKSEGMRDPLGGDPKNAKGPKALSLTQSQSEEHGRAMSAHAAQEEVPQMPRIGTEYATREYPGCKRRRQHRSSAAIRTPLNGRSGSGSTVATSSTRGPVAGFHRK